MTRPLRSIPITGTSSLIRGDPPLCSASVLSLLWVLHLNFSLNIGATASHVPRKSQDKIHAAFMPDAVWTVNRFPPNLSRINDYSPVLTPSLRFRTLHQRFVCTHLSYPHLIPSCGTFSSTLTTTALYHSSLRWFEACSCKPAPRDLPSSLAQLRTPQQLYIECARGTQSSAKRMIKHRPFVRGVTSFTNHSSRT